MKIQIQRKGDETHINMTDGRDKFTLDVSYVDVILTEVFNGVLIETEDDGGFGIAQRDSGLEIRCPDGTLVGVKRMTDGSTFIERNGEIISE